MTVSHTVERPARMSRDARRQHYLDVAAEIVLDRGIEAVTMEGVAAAAGVSKGLGYAYFENRNELLVALLERELSAYERRTSERIAAAPDFEAKLRVAVAGWFDMVEERGRLLGTLLQAGQVQEKLQPKRRVWFRTIEEFFGRLAAEELGIPEPKAVVAAAILIAGLAGVVDRLAECGEPRALLEETYIDVALGAVRQLR